MTPLIGTIVCIAVIAWLFYLDRDVRVPASHALWIPTVWLLINASRSVSTWLQINPTVTLTQRYSEGNPLDATIFGILILAGAVVLNSRSRQVKQFLHQNLPLLVFFAYCALSVAWSDHSFIAAKRWAKSLGDLVMVMVVLTDPHPLVALKRVFTRASFVLLPLSVLFIECYPGMGSAFNPDDQAMMYFGVTTFKNLLGMICMVFGLASLWSFIGTYQDRAMPHRIRHLTAHGLLIAIAIWLIVTADSMTSLACLFLMGSIMVMISQGWAARRPGSVHLIIWSALGLPVFALFLDTVGTLVHALGRNTTLTDRTLIWKAVLAIHTNPLLGTGFESFWLGNRLEAVWNMSVKGIQEAHNGYLELYLNLGFIGLFLLGVMIVTGYRHAFAAFRRDPQEGRIRLAFLTTALVYSLTEAGFRMLTPVWLALLLAVTGVPLAVRAKERQEVPASPWTRTARPKQIRILQ